MQVSLSGVRMKMLSTIAGLLLILSVLGVDGFLPRTAAHEIPYDKQFPSLLEKISTPSVIHDEADHCSWLIACICRDESVYTNDSYKLMMNCTQSGLQSVPHYIPNTTTVLTLDGNALQKIKPGTFRNLILLGYLDLSDNILDSLNEGVFEGLENLHTLELSGNKIRYDPAFLPDNVFKPLKKLVRLNLHQKLDGIGKSEKYPTNSLSELKHLKHLLIDGLQSENMNETFSCVTTLRTLELSSNCGRCILKRITVDMFRNLSSITDLKIKDHAKI